MKFSVAFVSAALAGAVLARPSSLAQRVQSRADGTRRHRTQPMVKVGSSVKENAKFVADTGNTTAHVDYSSNWSGAVLEQPSSGYFTSATGRFTVPTPQHVGSDGTEYSTAWVGIDGDSCASGLLQAGVDFTVTASGDVSYDSWYEWYPDYSYDFSNFDVEAGDVIQVDITATSTTKGTVKLTNVSTGKSVSKTLSAPSGSVLCRQNAEWIVEDFEQNGSLVALNNFDSVVFSHASAALSTGGSDDLSSATIIDLKQGSTVYTDVTIDSGSQVSVTYV
ncbi:acid protease [Didymella exigua CBS 183.55]|uniref:Acid protease n=1 Tax=Didymella exigua CBS 183.55 TaxID=1150837 RepID=A0A6A5R8B1_9PLEO|nr:acid protease [Didymella exigua CBS 183.55]KAF1923549.1 acid protease [Didymella exigua CBS 183.55]